MAGRGAAVWQLELCRHGNLRTRTADERFDRRRRSEVAGDCFRCDGDRFQCPIFGVLAGVGWPRSIDVGGHDHPFWPGWERLITRIGKAYLHPSRPCRKPECHRKVGGSGRETGARDVSDCRCEQRPRMSQNRDLSTRPASCPMMASDAVQRVSWSRAETEKTSQCRQVAGRTRRRGHSGFCLICDASTSRRLSEGAYQRSASKRNARHPIPILIVARCTSRPVVLQVMARRAPAEPKFGMQHCRGPDRRTTVAVGFIRSTVLFAARSVMMGGRNEVTAGGGGRKTGRGGLHARGLSRELRHCGDSPGDV